MITGSCHCEAVHYEYNHTPRWTTSCNCSICRRLGALWIYAKVPLIKVTGPTISYAWGEKSLAFHSCNICGCTPHWENLKPTEPDARMAVNLRLADPEVITTVRVRHFDGADTWAFLD
ncbi:GFA family protein [Yoonia sp. F2084L]|uniref:GFA family protein n=1 Tax=Yoonia sp. F2084L TaxID=2926419 RepID=UPI001FF67641|nr:GFA family protein [Yoonia sp. F2084L]MCK0095488.1 GFA family protein [Yoonia sp. F2084L]